MKKSFINWCRDCHFDVFICVKEVKGKKWMAILRHIENDGNFDIDDFKSINDSWKKILHTINSMTSEKINYLFYLRNNL